MEPPSAKPTPPSSAMAAPRTARAHVLRFISGKYQGGEFPLPRSGEVVAGRSSELDMVLVEDMVSRRHAKITVASDQILIQDLGSTNGTFVNGEKVKQRRLSEGDRILIGTSIIKLVATDGLPNVEEAKARLIDVAARKRNSQVRTMTGLIAEVPLPDLLQLFSASKKSGVLCVTTDADTGRVFLDRGKVVYATINDAKDVGPLKSLFRIFTWKTGTFDMESLEQRDFEDPINMATEALLMEGMRQVDELQQQSEKLPAMTCTVTLARPLVPPLRDLSDAELDVLQLVHNFGHLETVINRCPRTDSETCSLLAKLLDGGYLRTV